MKQWELRGVTVDVTARPADVSLLPVEDVSIRSLVDQFPAAFWTTDAELRFTSSLGAGLAGFGLGPNQLVGTTLFEFFETEDPKFPPIDAHKRALLGATITFELEWAGLTFHSQVAPLHDSEGVTIGTICVALGEVEASDESSDRRSALSSVS
jgi:PAS domain-containing protein